MSLLTLLSSGVAAAQGLVARGAIRPVFVPKATRPPQRAAPQIIRAAFIAAAGSLTLTADVGTFAVSGQAASFRVSRASSVGTFALTGQAAALKVTKKLISSVGAFTLTGQAASLVPSRILTGEVGTFILSGQNATLRRVRSLTSSVGTFVLSGQPATLGKSRRLTSDAGTFVFTGKNATLVKAKLLSGGAGTFVLSGKDATFLYRRSQVGQNQIGLFPSPVNSVGAIDSNTVRANDNITVEALNAHDSNAAIHMQSGTLINRPLTTAEGATYFCTDTRDTYVYTGGAWVQSAWAHWYCSFLDYTDQTTAAANTATKITFNTTDIVHGFSLVSSSRMTAAYAGTYNFQWSGQFANSDASEQDIDVWVRINGVDLTGSTGRISIPKKHGSIDGHALPGWNYYLTLAAGDYVELYWSATNTAVSLQTTAASAWAPSTASVIATMTRV